MELSREEFMEVIETLSAIRDPEDVRTTPRTVLRRTVLLVSEPYGDVQPVRLRDISRGGIGFAHHQAMARGSQFLLRLPTEGGGTRDIRCTVKHCHAGHADEYIIGAKFDIESAKGT